MKIRQAFPGLQLKDISKSAIYLLAVARSPWLCLCSGWPSLRLCTITGLSPRNTTEKERNWKIEEIIKEDKAKKETARK